MAQTFFDDHDLLLAVNELAKEENEDAEELMESAEEYFGGSAYKVGRWVLFPDYDTASEEALSQVRENLENEPEMFNENWLLTHIDDEACERFFREVYHEWNSSYAYDIENESAFDGDFENRLEQEMSEAGVDDVEDFIEQMTQRQIDEGNGGYEHYKFNFGDDEAKKLLMEHNLLDLDAAAEDAIDVDGWQHFLSPYDGNSYDLPSGAVYYREY